MVSLRQQQAEKGRVGSRREVQVHGLFIGSDCIFTST